ncbi:MAG TPA: N-acetylglucosamine-6-phosphate deacetylase [Vitreimonas sp.]|uniref:N-acetylglucosamine-6-phosphate deacetylase n=1 Tax=Vitreimonas sp. TaxID=3069702 RepID=UPI002D45B032|nr:N-acetylglucosamine-6-phosphate deacetylase [Vitreimonas sp.]HYD86753.1 N-acetylglucosamine-6-phosphate deacetylase [Vitreimonas sp.]
MSTALINARVLTPAGLKDDLAVVLEAGRIADVRAAEALPARARIEDLGGGVLAPGFVDVQVNGGGGVLFNDDPSVEAIEAIGAAHRRFGTTGFMPTLISDELDIIARAIDATRQAMERKIPGVLGVHIEGPFLSAARKGAHDPRKFRQLDDDALNLLTSLGAGRTLITLAPEETTPDMIRRLVEAGAIVSAGHTNATYEEMQAAIGAGLSGFTHIFNAMSPLSSRAPGAVGAALEDQTTWCGMIVDGRHVDPVVLRIALRCKPLDRFMLVTDAMPTVGDAKPSFQLQGRTIEVRDGVCVAPDGALAGSNLDMAQAFRNSMTMLGLNLEQASTLASSNAARFLRLTDLGAIRAGARASLVLLDEALQVKRVWIDGA